MEDIPLFCFALFSFFFIVSPLFFFILEKGEGGRPLSPFPKRKVGFVRFFFVFFLAWLEKLVCSMADSGLSRDLEAARKAFKEGDVKASQMAHLASTHAQSEKKHHK